MSVKSKTCRQGRINEASEILQLKKAAAVGRLMLGELDTSLEKIDLDSYLAKPRREIKAEIAALRSSLKSELRKFCQRNFVDATPQNLSNLFDDILNHNSQYRLPINEFIKCVGQWSASRKLTHMDSHI